MELPDFTNLPLTALFTYLILIAAIDVGFNIIMAIVHGNFSGSYVADFLRTHILLRVFIIGALGILGHGVPALGVPAIPAVSLAATGGLAAYVVETVASLVQALHETTPRPQPPTPTPSG
jgi:hypothetical protein